MKKFDLIAIKIKYSKINNLCNNKTNKINRILTKSKIIKKLLKPKKNLQKLDF